MFNRDNIHIKGCSLFPFEFEEPIQKKEKKDYIMFDGLKIPYNIIKRHGYGFMELTNGHKLIFRV